MKVYVDMDDVLCETAASLCRLAAREFGRHVPYEEVFDFDLQRVFDLSDAEMRRFMALSHAPETLAAYPVTPGAVEGIRALQAAGHAVEIVTGRPAAAHAGTRRWLVAAGLGDLPVVYVDKYGRDACYAHHAGDPATLTMDELLARTYDVAIDDSPPALERLSAWDRTRLLVFDRPWNRAYRLAPGMRRVAGWKGVADVLAVRRRSLVAGVLAVALACVAPLTAAAAEPPLETVSGGSALQWARPAADDPVLTLIPEPVRGGIVVATVPGKGTLPGFNGGFGQPSDYPVQLFHGGRRLPLARYPNAGNLYITGGEQNFPKGGPKPKSVTFTTDADAARLAAWAKEPELWAEGEWRWNWAGSSVKVEKVDPVAGTLEIGTRWVSYGIAKGNSTGGGLHVRNAFSEIDMPGEWAADLKRRRIYLYPPVEGLTGIEASMADHLLVLTNAHDVVIEGKVFENCRKDAIVLVDCTNVVIRRSVVRNTGGWGVTVKGGRNCRVMGCDIYNTGEGGVTATGGDRDRLLPGGHAVENCHIHHVGEWIHHYRPAVWLEGVGGRCAHNLIHDLRHAAVIYGGNDQYVGYNVVHGTCIGNFDCGALYTHTKHDWSSRGHLVEYNCIFATGSLRCGTETHGIYIDGWSSGVTVRGNIVVDASLGIFQNGGNDNVYERNIVLCCEHPLRRANLGLQRGTRPHPHVKDGRGSPLYRLLLARKTLYETPLWRTHYPNMLRVLDFEDPVFAHNALFTVATNNVWCWSGRPVFEDADQLSRWQTVTNNVTLDDPGFVDYEGFDWELRPDAPARRIVGGSSRFGEMGLYASADRVSPPVKFGAGLPKPRRVHRYPAPLVLAKVVFDSAPATGACAVACHACGVNRPWHPGVRKVSALLGEPPLESGWTRHEFSFTPTLDTTATLYLEGWRGERTAYDDIRMTGATLADGGFETGGAWECEPVGAGMDQYGIAEPPYGIVGEFAGVRPHAGRGMCLANFYLKVRQRGIVLKKGIPVTVSLFARPAVR